MIDKPHYLFFPNTVLANQLLIDQLKFTTFATMALLLT